MTIQLTMTINFITLYPLKVLGDKWGRENSIGDENHQKRHTPTHPIRAVPTNLYGAV